MEFSLSPLLELPPEIWDKIFNNLDTTSIGNARRAMPRLRNVSTFPLRKRIHCDGKTMEQKEKAFILPLRECDTMTITEGQIPAESSPRGRGSPRGRANSDQMQLFLEFTKQEAGFLVVENGRGNVLVEVIWHCEWKRFIIRMTLNPSGISVQDFNFNGTSFFSTFTNLRILAINMSTPYSLEALLENEGTSNQEVPSLIQLTLDFIIFKDNESGGPHLWQMDNLSTCYPKLKELTLKFGDPRCVTVLDQVVAIVAFGVGNSGNEISVKERCKLSLA